MKALISQYQFDSAKTKALEARLPHILAQFSDVLSPDCSWRNLCNCFYKWQKKNSDGLALAAVVGEKRPRDPEHDHKLIEFADIAQKRVKDLIGEQGLKHLSSASKSAVNAFYEVKHTDPTYYRKMFGVYLKVTDAAGQSYIDYFCNDSGIPVAQAADNLSSVEKLYLWLKTDLDDVLDVKFSIISAEVSNLIT